MNVRVPSEPESTSGQPPTASTTPLVDSNPLPALQLDDAYIAFQIRPCAWCRREYLDSQLSRVYPRDEWVCWACVTAYRQLEGVA